MQVGLHRYLPLQCRHLIQALNARVAQSKYTTARPIATQFPGHGCMEDLTNKRNFDLQATWAIDMLGLFFDKLSRGVCTTKHWRTSGRLVQEFNVCAVYYEREGIFHQQIPFARNEYAFYRNAITLSVHQYTNPIHQFSIDST